MSITKKPLSRRLSPDAPGGIKKVQVGCGPHNILPDWWNVDIRWFPGIDLVMDVTHPWSFTQLEYVYGEHFLEHLSLEGTVAFLDHAWNSLKPSGIIRLSTPALEYVLSTHFNLSEANAEKRISSTLAMNRAFHGWGHQFLYSQEFLTSLLENFGYQKITYCDYGKSEYPDLIGLERHGGYNVVNGYPSVWIVEAQPGTTRPDAAKLSYASYLEESYLKYLRSGH